MRLVRAMLLTIGLSAPMAGIAQINPDQIQGNGEPIAPFGQVQGNGNPVEALHQISTGQDNVVVAPQLTAADAQNQQVQQITSATRSIQPIQLIAGSERKSVPSVDHITETDHCDPIARRPDLEHRCSQFLESNPDRLVERDAWQPSPEKALLHDDWQFGASEQVESATRRLQATGDPDGSFIAMGVASLVLGSIATQVTPQKKDDAPAADFATQDILNFLQLPSTP